MEKIIHKIIPGTSETFLQNLSNATSLFAMCKDPSPIPVDHRVMREILDELKEKSAEIDRLEEEIFKLKEAKLLNGN